MREIQFRAKRMDTGEWVQSGNLLHFNEGNEIFIPARDSHVVAEVDEKINIIGLEAMTFFRVHGETVGQYTGRADVADHPVFEGDIINVPGTEDAVGVVRFGNHPPHVSYLEGTGTGFYIDWQGEKYHGVLRSDIGYWLDHAESVVIGNIFDNPELLEVKS